MLTDAKARAVKPKDKDYKLAAGEGLYLQVRTNGGKYWKLKFRFGGKERKLSFGVYPAVSLRQAREKATEAKTIINSTLKQAHAQFLMDGAAPQSTNANMNSNYGTPLDDATKFDYEQVSWSTPVWTVKAVGNATDSGLNGKELDACINFNTGIIDVQSQLDSATAVSCS